MSESIFHDTNLITENGIGTRYTIYHEINRKEKPHVYFPIVVPLFFFFHFYSSCLRSSFLQLKTIKFSPHGHGGTQWIFCLYTTCFLITSVWGWKEITKVYQFHKFRNCHIQYIVRIHILYISFFDKPGTSISHLWILLSKITTTNLI